MSELTPMMQQYRRIKAQYPDTVLFYRLGDFYEMFEKDAKEVSRILNLTLTARHGVPMCGIPYHASKNYIPRLLNAGKKIAVCEQTTLPGKGKGIVEREVIEVITPGTVVNEDYLSRYANNYLVVIGRYREYLSFAYIDLSTSEFAATSIPYEERAEYLKKELFRLNPSECIIQESLHETDITIKNIINTNPSLYINRYQDWYFDSEAAFDTLIRQFNVRNLKAFGLDKNSPELVSCGVLLNYIADSSKTLLPHIRSLHVYHDREYLDIDEATQRNLEIIQNLHDSSQNFTLISVLDKTRTAMGARKLKRWLLHPLKQKEKIEYRLNSVDALYHNQLLLSEIRDSLGSVLDIERLTSRIAMDKAHAKDLAALGSSLKKIGNINELIISAGEIPIKPLSPSDQKKMAADADLISKSIADEPSILLSEGNLIKDGYNNDLDVLKNIRKNSQKMLKEYLKQEQDISGIASLKIKYNKIIGHFIEVTKANLNQVPDHFIRRQSLLNCERYTTDKLIELESSINSASDKIIDYERELFLEIRNRIKENISLFLQIAAFISDIDCLQGFAQAATVYGYVKPVLSEGNSLSIINGRHPVVENNLPPGDFIPNSLNLKADKQFFAMITGPNMAGKSTYLRQIALIVLMAQSGSFIPAEQADIGITDKIFCRVGASDNLARGESTFLVEMNETAFILRHATKKSLVIMDEVGRGTSTNDGLSIAWAVTEQLLSMRIKTLFATHYHELSRIKDEHLVNLHLEIIEKNSEIIFLKRVREGASEKSYGIHVAKLAGIPSRVLERAENILYSLSEKEISVSDTPPEKINDSLFSKCELLENELNSVDIDTLTPLEALNTLANLKKHIESPL